MNVPWESITVGGVLHVLLLGVLLPWVVLTKKRQSASTVAWMLAIIMVPFLGGLMFVLFGINRVDRRAARKKFASRTIGSSLPELSQYQLMPGDALSPQQEQLIRLASRVGGTTPTFGNKIELLADTNRAMGLMEQAILSARDSLHLEYYIWQPDRTGTRVRDLLIQKAKEGVTVRFLYDRIGSIYLSNWFLKPMREAGIRVATFLPGPTLPERWSLNLRSHRKILIVDGQVGFTGGMNIGDEYVGKNPQFGYWRDTHMRLGGPVVLQLQQVFVEDWFYATGEELTRPEIFPRPEESGGVSAQVLPGGPSGDADVLHAMMFAAINEARDEVLLATSYFAPPASLVTALETAAYRGVKVRLLLAGRSAYQWTVWAGRSYYDSLLKAGVEIYEYRGGLLHSKTLTIDGVWSLVGTPNFDARSLFLNFEVAVAMYDSKIAAQLQDQFRDDLERAEKIEPDSWPGRPIRKRLVENVCRLLSPVL